MFLLAVYARGREVKKMVWWFEWERLSGSHV